MKRTFAFGLVLTFLVPSVFAIDVELVIPTVEPQNELALLTDTLGINFEGLIANQLQPLANELETTIEDNPDVRRFTELSRVAKGFANAGATASHLGTPRAFNDYRTFAVLLGTGVGVAAPGVEPETIMRAAEDIEEEGDIYVGAAIQPITAALGINISRWLDRTRAYVKFGYFDIPSGTVTDEVAFNSLSIGTGMSYQLLLSRQLPLGIIRWRGLGVSSGVLFQRNTTDIDIQVTDQVFTTDQNQYVTFRDLGFSTIELQTVVDPNLTQDSPIGGLQVTPPAITAQIESRTFSIPLEVSTGLRFLWLLDINFGAGVDLSFGASDLSVGAGTEAEFVIAPEARQYISATPGSASFTIETSAEPQFLRPRVTAGAGLNLGPVKLDIPVMLFFDDEGNSIMAGANLGIVW